MPYSEHRMTLGKRPHTRDGKIKLTTSTGDVYELAKAGELSRLDNWRKLLGPGRDVIIIFREDGTPEIASLKIKDDDELVWDCPPAHQRDWVVFWVGVSEAGT